MKDNKNNNYDKKKVYKSKTRNNESELIELYSRSKDFEKDKRTLEIIKLCFKSISAFTNYSHDKVVDKLYFNSNYNVIDSGIVKMMDLVFMKESTLQRYRNKYSRVLEAVLPLIENSDL